MRPGIVAATEVVHKPFPQFIVYEYLALDRASALTFVQNGPFSPNFIAKITPQIVAPENVSKMLFWSSMNLLHFPRKKA